MGRHVAAALSAQHNVIQLNRRSTGVGTEIVHDLRETLRFEQLPRQIDMIIHAGGLVGQASGTVEELRRINVDATEELARYAVHAGASRFILFSTGGVYRPTNEILTEGSEVAPEDEYGRSKLAAEVVAQSFKNRLVVQVLRLFFPFGPGQLGRLIPNLIQRISNGESISVMNPAGQPILTPLFVKDLVEYVSRVVRLPDGFVANLAGPEEISLFELASRIANLLGLDAIFSENRSRLPCNWRGNSDLISNLTMFAPETSLLEAIRQTVLEFLNAARSGGARLRSK